MGLTGNVVDISKYLSAKLLTKWLKEKNIDASYYTSNILAIEKNSRFTAYTTKQKLIQFPLEDDFSAIEEHVKTFLDNVEQDFGDEIVTVMHFSPAHALPYVNTVSLGLYGFIVGDVLELEMVYLAETEDSVLYDV